MLIIAKFGNVMSDACGLEFLKPCARGLNFSIVIFKERDRERNLGQINGPLDQPNLYLHYLDWNIIKDNSDSIYILNEHPRDGFTYNLAYLHQKTKRRRPEAV